MNLKKNKNAITVNETVKTVNTYRVREFNAVAVILFVLSFGLCGVFGWIDIIDYLLNDAKYELSEPFVIPIRYTLMCAFFVVLLIALAVLGLIIRSKLMVFLSATYQAIFVIAFIVFAIISTGGISNLTVYNVALYSLTVVLIPVYGLMWEIGSFFFLIFVPLLIFTVVAAIKVVKKAK